MTESYRGSMERRPVTSSSLASVGFDSDRQILEVEFRNAKIYQYFEVPESVFLKLLEAESKGRYFNLHVRDLYRYERLV